MADDESLDQEIEPTPFISKALIGRFLAVGVFVALGTFAVIQSVSGKKDAGDDHAGHDHADVADSILSAEEKVTPVISSAKSKLAGFLTGGKSNSASNTAIAKPAQPPVEPITKKTPTTFSASSGFNATRSPAARPSPKPLSRPIAKTSKPLVDPIVRKTPPTSFGTSSSGSVTLRPKTKTPLESKTKPKPPERLAQAPGGGFLPTIGKQGFGQPQSSTAKPTTEKPAAKPPAKSFGGFQSSSRTSSSSFSDLKKTVGSETNALFDAASKKAQSGINAISATGESARRQIKAAAEPVAQLKNDLGNHLSRRLETSREEPAKRPPAENSSSRFNRGGFNSAGFSSASAVKKSPEAQKTNTLAGNDSRSDSRSRLNSTQYGSSQYGSSRSNPSSQTLERTSTMNSPATRRTTGTTTNSAPARGRQAFTKAQNSAKPNNNLQQRSSSKTSPATQLASANSSARTRSTPGERRLEGVQSPSLTIEKVSPREIQVDQPADFEIRVRNVGRVPAADVMVIDRVPSGTEFLGATPEPGRSPTSGGLQWDIGTLEPGQEKRIRYQLKPTQPGEIGSVAQVVFATQASMRTIVTKPVLDIQHATSPKALMGDNFVFDVIVENRGDGPATDVIIQEEVPEQLEYQAGFRQLEYEVGTLLPGQKRQLRLALKAGKVGKFRNVMFATGKGGLEAKHALDLEVVAPEMRVSSAGPNRRFLQRKATHRFTVENRGTAKATNVDLVARLPSGLKYVNSDNRGRYDAQSHAVYWKMPELNDGVAGTVEITTMPVSVGQQNIKFEAEADLKLTASTNQEMVVEHLIDVFFDIDDVIDPIEVGSETSYRIRILNQGTKAASNVQLQIDFPPGLMPQSVDGNLRHQISGQRVMFEPIGSLPPGQEITLSVKAQGKAPGDHRVVANIRADGRDVAISKEDTTRVYSDR